MNILICYQHRLTLNLINKLSWLAETVEYFVCACMFCRYDYSMFEQIIYSVIIYTPKECS